MSEATNNNNSNASNSTQQNCANCGSAGENLRFCGRCHAVAYCNRDCQKVDWKARHKQVCGSTTEATPTSTATRTTSNSNTCSQCHGPCSAGPSAMYRTTVPGGDEYFMGIVGFHDSTRLVKLNDPAGELDGPGYDMSDAEFFTECFHYGNCNYPRELPPVKTEDLFLRDFADKPRDFVDTQQDTFHVKYPHGHSNAHHRTCHIGPTPQIRYGDSVRLMAQREMIPGLPPATERFWAQVISITAFGMVTAVCRNDLNCIQVHEDDFIAFPVTRIIGMTRGERWP